MVRIHDARLLDIPALIACMRMMHAESATFSKYEFLEDHADHILRTILTDRPETFFLKVATDDETGDVVGFLGGEVLDDLWTKSTRASDHGLYVRPGHRGRVGKDLMALFIDWARRNADRMDLQVAAGIDDKRGGKFMAAMGLEPRGFLFGKEF